MVTDDTDFKRLILGLPLQPIVGNVYKITFAGAEAREAKVSQLYVNGLFDFLMVELEGFVDVNDMCCKEWFELAEAGHIVLMEGQFEPGPPDSWKLMAWKQIESRVFAGRV